MTSNGGSLQSCPETQQASQVPCKESPGASKANHGEELKEERGERGAGEQEEEDVEEGGERKRKKSMQKKCTFLVLSKTGFGSGFLLSPLHP